jgi:PAS domain-containing protein
MILEHESTSPVASLIATPAAVQVDAEMTDCNSAAGSQFGYDADEVEAANTLLEIAGGRSEAREAATTLMEMHKADALLAGQSGPSDEKVRESVNSKMNDA